MDLLARREHSFCELTNKLVRKGHEQGIVTPVLERLVEDSLLSDWRFAENYLMFRSRKGFGPRRIRKELEQRGVAEDIITHAFKQASLNWQDMVQQVWQKRFGILPATVLDKAKQFRFLLYRGFDEQVINRLFVTLSSEEEIG